MNLHPSQTLMLLLITKDFLNRLADALCEPETSTQSKSKHSKVECALQPEAETPPSGSDPEPADQNTSLAFEVVKYVKVDASVAGAIASAVDVVEGKVEEAEAELKSAESTAWAVVEAVEVEAIDEDGEKDACEEAPIIREITSSGVMEVPEDKIKEESSAASGAIMEFDPEGVKEDSENESNRKDVAADAQPETTQDSESSTISPDVSVEESVSPAAEGTSPASEVVVCVLDSSVVETLIPKVLVLAENEEAEVEVEKAIAGAEAVVGAVVEAETEVEAMAAKSEDSPQSEKERRAKLCKSDSGMDSDGTEEPDLTPPPSSAQESVEAIVESQEDSSAAVKLKEDSSTVLSKPKITI